MASLRLAVPRAGFSFHSKQLQHHRILFNLRHASSTRTPPPPPPKPRVLEQPDKFRPPSHPSRIRTRGPRYVGPALSEQELKTQRTKQYPHMMPPEGSFLHWFITNRSIHTWITMSILITLVIAIWLTDFLHKTPFTELLPPNSMFFSHPIAFLSRWAEVYQMHVAHVSAETAERRRQKVEDVRKRSEYRKAHGLEQAEGNSWGGWTVQADENVRGPGMKEGNVVPVVEVAIEAPAEPARVEDGAGQGAETYVDFDGKVQTVRKKWLGIW